MIQKLKCIFLIIAIIAITTLGILIFSPSDINLILLKIFGISGLIGLWGEAICIWIEYLKRK